jgi:hypothetical protein
MGKKRKDQKAGYGKLLDAWIAPDDAGDPIGCVATSFTFSPVFFEEECLARFLQLQSDPSEDGPYYLIEREEKLAQVTCAAALVDQHHCRGSRSLRWDLLAARPRQGVQHAKVALLYWSKLLRVIVASANLTEDGYRRNQEVFGVLDYKPGSEAPQSCLVDVIDFLRRAATTSSVSADAQSPALVRWNQLLDRASRECRTWGSTDDELRRAGIRVTPIFSGLDYPDMFTSLRAMWPSYSPPDAAAVVSPFFDRPEVFNAPASELWKLMRQRGLTTVAFHVAGEDVPGEDKVFLHAPKSLLAAKPSRENAITEIYRVTPEDRRPLHAKGLWLEDDRWVVYTIGSSNFTSAGTGVGKVRNLEANLAYIVDTQREPSARSQLTHTFPKSEPVDLNGNVDWKPLAEDCEDLVGEEIVLPGAFADAIFDCDAENRATVSLSFAGNPPSGWSLTTDGDDRRLFDEAQWQSMQQPTTIILPWEPDRPPSGFWVRWTGSNGAAWWPVNVLNGNTLPPPEGLKSLPLEVLINILSSARPLNRVLGDYLRRKEREKSLAANQTVIDPHKRVDTSRFLLQRTRRISSALSALRERLERPAATMEILEWRLRGPVGVMAFAKALVREENPPNEKSPEERAFLITELVLELARVHPQTSEGCVPVERHIAAIRGIIPEVKQLLPENESGIPNNLREYVATVFSTVGA